MQKPHVGELIFFFALFGVVALLTVGIMSPFVVPLFLGVVFAIVFAPIHRVVDKAIPRHPTLAALTSTLAVLILILFPLIILSFLLVQEVNDLYITLSTGQGESMIRVFSEKVQYIGAKLIPGFKFNINLVSLAQNALAWLWLNMSAFFSGIATFALDVLLLIVAIFFFFRDGGRLRKFIIAWSPLSDRYDQSILMKLETAVVSVVKGSLMTAAVQGILVGFGFTIFGLPSPILWGCVAAVAALIPLIGTSIITMPAAATLILTGHVGSGIGLVLYALVIVGLSDNILRPIFLRRSVDIHPFLILLSVIGGLSYFGPIGFLVGPIVVAFFFTLLEVYPEIVKGKPIENVS